MCPVKLKDVSLFYRFGIVFAAIDTYMKNTGNVGPWKGQIVMLRLGKLVGHNCTDLRGGNQVVGPRHVSD